MRTENEDRSQEVYDLAWDLAKKLEGIPAPPMTKLAVIPTLFDHICETYRLPKKHMAALIFHIIEEVQKAEGNMYPAERKGPPY